MRVAIVLLTLFLFAAHAVSQTIFDEDPEPSRTRPQQKEPPKEPTAPAEESSAPLPKPEAAPTKRSAVPNPKAQANAEKFIREVMPEVFADRTSDGRKRGAATLAKLAGEEPDVSRRFVLLREARDMAAAAGDYSSAFVTAKTISEHFETTYADSAIAAIKAASTASATDRESLVRSALDLVEFAVTEGAFDDAEDLCKTIEPVAAKANPQLLAQVRTRMKELSAIRLQSKQFESAKAVLARDPDDKAANLAAGTFLCFYQSRWDEGVGYLAKGSNEDLKKLAELDLQAAADATRQKSAGDGWWAYAQKQDATLKGSILARAWHHYRMSLPKLQGLEKALVEKRFKDAGEPTVSSAAAQMKRSPEVDAAIKKAVAFLYAQQKPWGHWDAQAKLNNKPADAEGLQYGGLTGTAVFALLMAGEDPKSSPQLDSGLQWLAKLEPAGMYSVSFQMMSFGATANPNLFKRQFNANFALLSRSIRTDGRASYALGTIPTIEDLSCTQHAWLGLVEAEKAGARAPVTAWQAIAKSLCSSQMADGGWSYQLSRDRAKEGMTAAAMTLLLLARDRINDSRLKPQIDQSLEMGFKWLDQNLKLTTDAYQLLAFQRVGLLSGRAKFGEFDWFEHGSRELLKWQRKDGALTISTDHVRRISYTSMAIVFLSRGGVQK